MKKNRYKDLEDLLFVGFLPYKVKICDFDFVFKSINDLEYRKISLMSGMKNEPAYSYKFHYNFLFHSIYMINGVNLLENRDGYYSEIVSILKDLPHPLLKRIFEELEKLTARVDKCTKLVEPYAYEDESRYYWMSRRKTQLNNYANTGLRGTEALGLNQFQRFWTVLNIRDDEKDSFEEKYSVAKFLASFTDSKSVKKIDASDKARKEEESKKRERIKILGTEEEKQYSYDPTASREGIIEELERQMKGIKDDHDLAIENHERRLRANMLKQMQEIKKVQEERQSTDRVMEEARPISREEMMERINKTRKSPKMYMKSIDEGESKYMEMSNIKTEDVLEESGLSKKGYNELVNKEMFKNIHKTIDEEDEVVEEYLIEQRKLASQAGVDEESDFDFPNLRNR